MALGLSWTRFEFESAAEIDEEALGIILKLYFIYIIYDICPTPKICDSYSVLWCYPVIGCGADTCYGIKPCFCQCQGQESPLVV